MKQTSQKIFTGFSILLLGLALTFIGCSNSADQAELQNIETKKH